MAICLKLPTLPIPQLPAPLTLTLPALPELPGLPAFCCKLPPLPISIPPIPIPSLILNPAVIATLNAFITSALSYINSLAISCPLE